MKNTKLIELLKTFSKEEMKEFEKFVASPYFSRGRDLMPFFKILKSYHPDFNNNNFTSENILRKIYTGIKYDKKKSENLIRVLSSDMTKLVMKYFSQSGFEYDSFKSDMYSLIELRVRRLDNMYIKLLNKLINESEKEESIRPYFQRMNTLMEEKFFFYRKRFSTDIMQSDKVCQEYVDNSVNIISECLIMLSYSKVFEKHNNVFYGKNIKSNVLDSFFNNFNYEKFISEIKNSDAKHLWLFELLFCYLNSYGNVKNIRRLREIVGNKIKHFHPNESTMFYGTVRNSLYDLSIQNEDRQDLKKEIFSYYKEILDKGIYKRRKFRLDLFKVILNSALEVDELEFAEKFSTDYLEKVESKYKETLWHYSNTAINLYKKEFDKALENINKINYDHPTFKIDLKLWTLKIHYEKNNFESVVSLIDTFKHQINNNKLIPVYIKPKYKPLFSYVMKLVKLNSQYNESVILDLKKEISSDKIVIERKWLIEKVNELANKNK